MEQGCKLPEIMKSIMDCIMKQGPIISKRFGLTKMPAA